MNALFRAEARKVLTTRSTLVVAGFVILYPVLSLLPAIFAPEAAEVDEGTLLQVLRGGAGVLTLAALLLGIVAVTGEHRHGTIVPSLLVAPRRRRFLAAKLGSQATLALVLSLAVGTVGLVAGSSYLATRDVTVDVLSSQVAATVGAAAVVAALYAVAGTAVGALVRNQTAAVAGALMWVFVVENAIPLVLHRPGLKRWLPGGLSDRLLHVADPVVSTGSASLALVLFSAVAVALAGAALAATTSADID